MYTPQPPNWSRFFLSNREQKHNRPGYSYHVITKTFPPQGPFLPDQFKPGQFFPSVTFGRFFPSSALLVNITRCIAKVMAKTIPTCGPISHIVNHHLFYRFKRTTSKCQNCPVLMTLQKIWTNHLLCCWLSTVRLIRRVCLLAQNTNTHWTAEETCGSPRLCTDLRKRPHWGGFGHIGNICTLHFHLLTSMLLPPLFFCNIMLIWNWAPVLVTRVEA